MPDQVERFSLECSEAFNDGGEDFPEIWVLEVADNGEWVRYSDYEKLHQRLAHGGEPDISGVKEAEDETFPCRTCKGEGTVYERGRRDRCPSCKNHPGKEGPDHA